MSFVMTFHSFLVFSKFISKQNAIIAVNQSIDRIKRNKSISSVSNVSDLYLQCILIHFGGKCFIKTSFSLDSSIRTTQNVSTRNASNTIERIHSIIIV